MATMVLRKKTDEGAYTDYSVDYVFEWPLTEEQVAFLGEAVLETRHSNFYAWVDNLHGQEPVWGDKWVDDLSRSWTIIGVDTLVRRTQFRCLCRRDVA